ncbi:MAG TPA: CPBP family intramembrane glutamic endopeptidase [Candidatus Acidoferrum sp.]|jgi:membrane protease YdiL (CAAX protease family)|nr:CPBP family intramembrane glutamic endopeptidase [Candidatus Acidoferrum sp.]
MVIAANAAVGKRWASHATGILAGLTAGGTFLVGALDLGGAGLVQAGPGGQQAALDGGIMVTAALAAILAARPVRERIARWLPIDPDSPVHAYALVLAVILFGTQLATTLFVDVLGIDQTLPPLGVGDLFYSETPFLIMALAGIGLYVRRNARGAADRLGLVRPAWWQITLALAAAGAFFALIQGADWLSHQWTPGIASQVDKTTAHVFGGLNDPVGIAAIALLPGICEEILFRGALQPRLGLLVTALLFTSVHTQYGLSFDALSVLVVAIGLGLIRKYTNTTTSGLAHITYNLLAGIGIGSLVGVAVAVELGLVGLAVYGIWSSRRRIVPAGELVEPSKVS